jgi:tetratricopeptide (TPR) repeat protein
MKESTINALRIFNTYKVYISIGVGVAIAIGAGVTFFVTEKARRIDTTWQNVWRINKDLAAAAQQHEKDEKSRNAALTTAADAYNYVKNTMSSSNATPWILFQLGNVYYSLKNYDAAIHEYNNFLDRYKNHPLAPVIKQSLGYAYEEKGLFPEAIKQFEDISAGNGFLAAQENWDAGRCYEKLGQTADAIRSYTKTIELSPNSNWATMAQYRLSVIR